MVNQILFDQDYGRVYLIPYEVEKAILSQVGYGGDIGIFDTTVNLGDEVNIFDVPLLFRVHYGLVSPRRFRWIDVGLFPYSKSLSHAASYFFQELGSELCFLISYGVADKPVTCDDRDKYEPLATWSHEHIIDRYTKEAAELP